MVLKKMTKPEKLVEVETGWVNINDCVPYSKAFPKGGKFVKGYDRKMQKTKYYNVSTNSVASIVKDFKPHLFGRPIVVKVKHAKYKYVIVDGNHRIEALKQLKKNGGLIEVQILEPNSVADEVMAFLDVNLKLRRLTFKEQFNARLFKEEEKAVGLYLQLQKYGVSIIGIDEKLTERTLDALWDFHQAYEKDSQSTDKCLETLTNAFDDYFSTTEWKYILSSRVIRAVSRFYKAFPDSAEVERLVKKLTKMELDERGKKVRKYTPNKLQALVESVYSIDKNNGATAILKFYNEDLKGSKRLEINKPIVPYTKS